MGNSGFKLLAIRPLEGCDERFLKNLKAGSIYQFYDEFHIDAGRNYQIERDKNHIVPEDFYSIERKSGKLLHVSISAICGKNGSGKSTLIEFIFLAAYLLGVEHEILLGKKQSVVKSKTKKIDKQAKKLIKEFNVLNRNEKIDSLLDFDDNINTTQFVKKYHQLKWIRSELDKVKESTKLFEDVKGKVAAEFYYLLNKKQYKLSIKDKVIKISHFKNSEWLEVSKNNDSGEDKDELDKKYLANHFFYSIALNYSHYALNSYEIGAWIERLFHKNDGYQTPAVINPMRTEGRIDINIENFLVRARLLVNVLTPFDGEDLQGSMRNLAEGKIAKTLRIELDDEKLKEENEDIEGVIAKNKDINEVIWKRLVKLLEIDLRTTETVWDEYAKHYLVLKLKSMAEKYPTYYDFDNIDLDKSDKLSKYLQKLKMDTSHITYKFWQTVHFLQFEYAFDYTPSDGAKKAFFVDIGALSDSIKTKIKPDQVRAKNPLNWMYYLPPPFLRTDILFVDWVEEFSKLEKESDTFGNMSSGEKQKIYATSSIMYHLRYLDSVQGEGKLPLAYRHINLIFDEIELYYHPELQRRFIHDFLNAIKQSDLKKIESINCIFVTHSPFILSDIPSQNIMYLDKQIQEDGSVKGVQLSSANLQSLGSNIHDLLKNGFFMESTTGAYIEKLIKEFVAFYYEVRLFHVKKYADQENTPDEEFYNLKEKFYSNREPYKFLAEEVGEDIISQVLLNHFKFLTDFFERRPL